MAHLPEEVPQELEGLTKELFKRIAYIDTGLANAPNTVIPANTGIQKTMQNVLSWTPAYAGVTEDFTPSG